MVDNQDPPSPSSLPKPAGEPQPYVVTTDLILAFRRDGFVVLPEVFTPREVEEAREGFHQTLLKYGVDWLNLEETAGALRRLSSTDGSGGVLDLFYPHWKLKLAESPRFFSAISQLWEATYASYSPTATAAVSPQAEEEEEDLSSLYSHPFGPFNPGRGYFYLDRVGFRVATRLSEAHKKGKRPLQRSLTPHLDCCPTNMYCTGKAVPRWRPIQSFIALTDNLDRSQESGGFECVPGFHREFSQWAVKRPPTQTPIGPVPAPCVGDFTPVRPVEDADVISRFRPVYYPAGSVIAFDWRLPHANASRNDVEVTREVAYASFLPDVGINRGYAAYQRGRYRERRIPLDQWLRPKSEVEDEPVYEFSELGKKLLGEVPWDPQLPPGQGDGGQ